LHLLRAGNDIENWQDTKRSLVLWIEPPPTDQRVDTILLVLWGYSNGEIKPALRRMRVAAFLLCHDQH